MEKIKSFTDMIMNVLSTSNTGAIFKVILFFIILGVGFYLKKILNERAIRESRRVAQNRRVHNRESNVSEQSEIDDTVSNIDDLIGG